MSKIGQQIENGVSQVVDEFVRAIFRRNERMQLEEKKLLELHNQTIDTLERQLTSELKEQNLVVHPTGNDPQVGEGSKNHNEPVIERIVKEENNVLQNHNGESVHKQVVTDMKKDLEQDLYNKSFVLERAEGPLHFKEINAGNIVFTDREQKEIIVEPKDLNVSLELRGRLEALQYYRSLSQSDVLKTLKEVQKVAKRDGRPVEEVYREKLQQKIELSISRSRETLLKQASITSGEIGNIKGKLRSAERTVNEKIGMLENVRLEGKIGKEEYQTLKKQLEGKKERIAGQLKQLEGAEKKLEIQVKNDLQAQYPNMEVSKLSLAESVAVGIAAERVTEKGIEKLKEYASSQKEDSLLKTLEKSTKQVEVVVEQTIEREVFTR
ncbi:hypothetical protein SAMN04487866_1227 [Thermoactinomyces sp. DSM 45891]|uniref:hypothetical protein n=1 Tax=Thermoactinomyces sp. DSM 45891 TaxID=1761907 RepID=UPI00091FC51D|nr:hypothetical protein [Thermoactinomyces sp. DSM 45891]SFX74592.1 hypothetical protein SAMN04487866_1227 [Thermoactinomyces sp. DSM 45891]